MKRGDDSKVNPTSFVRFKQIARNEKVLEESFKKDPSFIRDILDPP